MGNTVNPRPIEPILKQVEALGIAPRSPLWQLFQDLALRSDKTQTNLGEIRQEANLTGRTEQLSTTLQNVDSAGILTSSGVDLSRPYTNKTIDNINDGSSFVRTTPNEKTGAGRGFNALDSNNRLANSFRANAINVSNTPTSGTTLSNDGVSTSIPISAYTTQFPPGTVSYNSGSVDPGSFGKWYIYFDDPTFAGGAVTYQFTNTVQNQTAAEGRTSAGSITSLGGFARTGGGNTGGTNGAPAGKGFIQG